MMDTNQYMGMFLEESREHLQTLNSCVLDLENDPENLSVLSEIFRSAHTIKGMSATMGFTTIAELTHEMENILDLLRKSQLKASHDIIDTIFKCVDTLEQLVESVATNSESSIDSKPLIIKLKALAKGEFIVPTVAKTEKIATVSGVSSMELNDTEATVIRKARGQGMQAYEVQISLREGCLLKSARSYMVMNTLEELGEVIKSIPAVEELEKENFSLSFQVVIISGSEAEKIQQAVLSISEIDQVTVLPCVLPPDNNGQVITGQCKMRAKKREVL